MEEGWVGELVPTAMCHTFIPTNSDVEEVLNSSTMLG